MHFWSKWLQGWSLFFSYVTEWISLITLHLPYCFQHHPAWKCALLDWNSVRQHRINRWNFERLQQIWIPSFLCTIRRSDNTRFIFPQSTSLQVLDHTASLGWGGCAPRATHPNTAARLSDQEAHHYLLSSCSEEVKSLLYLRNGNPPAVGEQHAWAPMETHLHPL